MGFLHWSEGVEDRFMIYLLQDGVWGDVPVVVVVVVVAVLCLELVLWDVVLLLECWPKTVCQKKHVSAESATC